MDIDRFKNLVMPLRNKLMNVSQKLLENRADAEDVVQDAFLKLWRIRSQLDGYRSVEALAVTVARRLSLDMLRQRRNTEYAGEELTIASELHTPDNSLAERDAVNCIRRLIEQLPPLQQTIIRMKDIEGYEVAEIAEITGTLPDAVRANLSRARKRVREQYLLLNKERYEQG
ncbi:MAG: RNA polymerase sigma factor [Tannerellaceae bacterium]|jgi:RNA polymerase sigma-70 factor (ECF subfamily)|nr:RNA polymerase sigma factor [Tannerellaceae bacterium]